MGNYEMKSLFSDEELEEIRPKPKRPKLGGGSSNPLVFKDYESFVAKFVEKEKTTDDTYTPKDVFDAVVRYVSEIYDMEGKVILRPFYPGGDYENAEYPENGVVIDNPPFSMFTKICAFFSARRIPFFLFGPGLTIMSCVKYCTAVIISRQITFENKAVVKCNFASNLFGDVIVTTAPELEDYIDACPSQNVSVNLPSYIYDDRVLSVSDLQTICRGGIAFSVERKEAEIIRKLDNSPASGGLFGDHLLVGEAKAKAKAKAKGEIPIKLSEREERICRELDRRCLEL